MNCTYTDILTEALNDDKKLIERTESWGYATPPHDEVWTYAELSISYDLIYGYEVTKRECIITSEFEYEFIDGELFSFGVTSDNDD